MVQDVERKIDKIIESLTLEEKVFQMGMMQSRMFVDDEEKFSPEKADEIFKGYSLGGIQDARLSTPEKSAQFIKDAQEYIKTKTKPGIPALVVGEMLHGYMAAGATNFPQAIGLASSFNREAVHTVAEIASEEGKSVGCSLANAPNLDLAEDPRWGRVEETYGEDWYLTSELGCEYVKGAQSEGSRIVTALKHYAAHGCQEGGINLSPVSVGERELKRKYLKPFKRCIQDAGAFGLMPAYNEFDGIPIHGSRYMLDDMLRGYIGFEGMTIADYGAVEMLHHNHYAVPDYCMAGKMAVEAGMDFEAGRINCYGDKMISMVRAGKISEEYIDRAVRRVLRTKFFMGIMDGAEPAPEDVKNHYATPFHRKAAKEIADESIVLLENRGVLPLSKDTRSIAIVGPLADRAEVGDYCIPKEDAVSLLQGMKNKFDGEINYTQGCDLWRLGEEGFKEAIKAAQKSDVCIIVLGECSIRTSGIGWGSEEDEETLCGEGFDSHDLHLAGSQAELAKAILALGKPTIVVLLNGRPLDIGFISEKADALIEAWYPGEEGGTSLADIIFGDVNPSGKLPITFPKHVGQIPLYYSRKPMSRGYYGKPGSDDKLGRDYIFFDTNPLYPFGYGKSYTEFEYSNLVIENKNVTDDSDITVRVTVENTGEYDGKEAVLLFVKDVISTMPAPLKQLCAFEKVFIKKGEKKEVTLKIHQRDLEIIDQDFVEKVENGEFIVYIDKLEDSFCIEK